MDGSGDGWDRGVMNTLRFLRCSIYVMFDEGVWLERAFTTRRDRSQETKEIYITKKSRRDGDTYVFLPS